MPPCTSPGAAEPALPTLRLSLGPVRLRVPTKPTPDTNQLHLRDEEREQYGA